MNITVITFTLINYSSDATIKLLQTAWPYAVTVLKSQWSCRWAELLAGWGGAWVVWDQGDWQGEGGLGVTVRVG